MSLMILIDVIWLDYSRQLRGSTVAGKNDGESNNLIAFDGVWLDLIAFDGVWLDLIEFNGIQLHNWSNRNNDGEQGAD